MKLRLVIPLVIIATLSCRHNQPPALTTEEARKQLGQMNMSYSEDSFIEAARNGDIVAVNLFLASGMNTNTRASGGKLAHIYAKPEPQLGSMQYFLDAAKKHLEDPTNKDDKTILAMTPLMAAAISGKTEIVRLLLNKGADPNAQDTYKLTALMYATWQGHLEVVKILLDSGADPNVQVHKHERCCYPLVLAAEYGPLESILSLLDKSAEINSTCAGSTALMRAIKTGHIDIVKLLLERGADVHATDYFGSTALYEAVAVERPEIVKLLLDYGENPNENSDIDKITPLMRAAQNGNKEIVELLLARGANPNAKGTSGQTAVLSALMFNHMDVVMILRRAGARE